MLRWKGSWERSGSGFPKSLSAHSLQWNKDGLSCWDALGKLNPDRNGYRLTTKQEDVGTGFSHRMNVEDEIFKPSCLDTLQLICRRKYFKESNGAFFFFSFLSEWKRAVSVRRLCFTRSICEVTQRRYKLQTFLLCFVYIHTIFWLCLSSTARSCARYVLCSILVCGGLLQREDKLCLKQRERRQSLLWFGLFICNTTLYHWRQLLSTPAPCSCSWEFSPQAKSKYCMLSCL